MPTDRASGQPRRSHTGRLFPTAARFSARFGQTLWITDRPPQVNVVVSEPVIIMVTAFEVPLRPPTLPFPQKRWGLRQRDERRRYSAHRQPRACLLHQIDECSAIFTVVKSFPARITTGQHLVQVPPTNVARFSTSAYRNTSVIDSPEKGECSLFPVILTNVVSLLTCQQDEEETGPYRDQE